MWRFLLLPVLVLVGWSGHDAFVLRPQHHLGRRTIATVVVHHKNDDDDYRPRRTTIMNAAASVPPPPVEMMDDEDDYDDEMAMNNKVVVDRDDEDGVVDDNYFDVVIVGAGLGGLCAGAILNTVYNKKVGVFETHYHAGGCAHAFDFVFKGNMTFTFDAGPTILLGCSSQKNKNALRQVLDAVGESVEWIPYDGWGMIEYPGQDDDTNKKEKRWRVDLGPDRFADGPLMKFGGPLAVQEFHELRALTKDLVVGANIPAMAMRPGDKAIVPLLKYFGTLVRIILQGDKLTGTFGPYLDGPLYTVTSPWLRHWLDALAFSLSGLPAARTAAAAMGFVLNDMHRADAALDYPKGGMGVIVDALVRAVEKGGRGSRVVLRRRVASIDCDVLTGTRVTGVTLTRGNKKIVARDGVICNAPVWSLRQLIRDPRALRLLDAWGDKKGRGPPRPEDDDDATTTTARPNEPNVPMSCTASPDGSSFSIAGPRAATTKSSVDEEQRRRSFLSKCDTAEMTGSFLHLHLAIRTDGLDLQKLEAHYTVMDRGLAGNDKDEEDGPCGEANMIAVSNPCAIDPTLAPPGYAVLHAYGAANEPFDIWAGMDRRSEAYEQLKEKRAAVLWRAVESIFPDVRTRVVGRPLIGSPLTHERFLRRPKGTYGSATEDYLPDGRTPLETLVVANDGVFPGIGVPAVAIAGASAANAFVTVAEQWAALDRLRI